MAPIYVKPENALKLGKPQEYTDNKRTDELLALKTETAKEQAFENLFEVFQSKRFKYTPIPTLEPIVLKFVELCVELNRRQHLRYALSNYRNATQQTNTATIETVLNHLISHAESRLTSATEQAKTEVAALPENPKVDDELPLQPTAMLLDAFIDSTNDKERIERRLIAPAQKFCFDAYDIVLDICKNNDRLDVFYQSVAVRVFEFCKVHERKNDFRRLCEQRLRKDLANAAKYGHQQHSIDLTDPDTLQRLIDTRFLQLQTAVELELWQEAFRSVEDVHGLVAGKKQAKAGMMANYYEKLTQIFKAEGGASTAVFHAAAWGRYFQYAERTGPVSEKASGCVLLSALAVPIGQVETKQRLIALLNLAKMPTRDSLVRDAATKHLRRVHPAIRALYTAIEVEFHPLRAAKTIAPLISSLPAEYQPYLPALKDVVLSRILRGLANVYDSISLAQVVRIVKPFESTPWATDLATLEKFLMSSARRGEGKASVDHVKKSLSFTAPIRAQDQNRLANLAVSLHNALSVIRPPTVPAVLSREEAFAAAIAAAEEERKAIAHRRQIVQKRRELLEESKLRKAKEESTALAERQKVQAEEQARAAAEAHRQAEKDRIQKQIDNTRREEAKRLAEQLAAKGQLKVDMKEIENLDSDQVLQMQVQQLSKERKEMGERLRIVGKRVDHLERAMRKEERPLLVDDYARQKEDDKKAHEEMQKVAKEMAIAQQKAERELKERLGRMMPDYLVARAQVESQLKQELEKQRQQAQKRIAQEKDKFRTKVMERRKEERERRERERIEAEEREREEQERAEAEEAAARERAEKEAAAKAEIEARNAEAAAAADARRKEREEQRRKDDEIVRKQREREEEAERRRAERTSGAGAARPSGGAYRPPGAGAGAGANGSSSPAGGERPRFGAAASAAAGAGATGEGAGGWRARLAAKEASEGAAASAPAVNGARDTSGPVSGAPGASPAGAAAAATPSPSATPTPQAQEGAGGAYRPGQGKWSSRGRGGGGMGGGAPSTRGGAGGSRW